MARRPDKDPLGSRMKADYEERTRYYLPRRTYTLLRVDGRAFHTFTRGFDRPYDLGLMACMDAAAVGICAEIPGTRFAFVQSDEITVLITDFETPQTEAPFDGNVQKLCSISASAATAYFNQALTVHKPTASAPGERAGKVALFDSRVWTIPQTIEVYNALLWRQRDATRNAISMAAQATFSHRELQGKSTEEMLAMLSERGVAFDRLPAGFRRGRLVERVTRVADVEYTDKRTGERRIAANVERSSWEVCVPPEFGTVEGREWLLGRIPRAG